MNQVSKERTGWRCEKISRRHRTWGYNCPAVDLDFVVAEYNHEIPVALVEYKDVHAREPNLDDPTYKALAALADGYKNPLPFLIAFYNPDDWWFRVIPVNEAAKFYYEGRTLLTEQRFVKSLYYMRHKAILNKDQLLIEGLNNIAPPMEAA